MAKIAFYKGSGSTLLDSIISFTIKLWTHGPYSHVEFIDDGHGKCETEWKWYSASSRKEGYVREKKINIKQNNWDIFDIDGVHIWHTTNFFKEQFEKKYDWKGIFWTQFFKLNKTKHNKWFCSELVRRALCEGGVFPCDGNDHHYSPNDLYRELTKSGKIKWQKLLHEKD